MPETIAPIAELAVLVTDAYKNLKAKTEAAFDKTKNRQSADALVREMQQGILLQHADDPKALGANEAARNAKIAELTQAELADQSLAAKLEQQALHELKIASIDVEFVRTTLRVAELAAGIERQGR